ncbi:MAG: helicase-associated domain-containing protein [Oscillospiraceae bacterium]|nr:helicase-associated domain-containing protein [Oscillospiraceae bacterium]
MTPDQCARLLSDLQLGDKGRTGTLLHLAHVAGKKEYTAAKNASKAKIISILSDYYCAANRFEEIWNGLSDAEHRIISLHIWSSGSEPNNLADEVAAEFGVAENSERLYYYSRNGLSKYKDRYAEKDSKIWLLFPKSSNNWFFHNELSNAVGEMEREYSQVPNSLEFSSREDRINDFSNVVRFCNSNKVTMTKSGTLSKPSALKLWKYCGYEEYAADMRARPEDVKAADGLLVTFPLTVLCTIGGLLAITEGECVPGGKALSLINQPHEQLVKKLFETYLTSKSFDEISMIRGVKSKRGHRPFEGRQRLADELKHCPIGQAVYISEFEKYLRIADKTFARKEERYIVSVVNSYQDYGVNWEQYEYPLIRIILLFFSALGIIDIAWGEDLGSHIDRGRRRPIAFRINPLGAYVLGLSDSYVASVVLKEKIKGGFTALADYTIVVHDSSNRLKHEIFFEKLFTKVSATNEASIYRLDFDTIVRAIESGASVADLRNYLSASDKPLPENVARALDDWGKQVGRIRLRQVTILECDDAALLEEVIRYKGIGEFVVEKITAAAIVDGNSTKKIKKVIEKNKRFCNNAI